MKLNVISERSEIAEKTHCVKNSLTSNDIYKYNSTWSNESRMNVNAERSEVVDNLFGINKTLTCNDTLKHIYRKPIDKFKNPTTHIYHNINNYSIKENSKGVGNILKLQFLNLGGLSSKLKFPDIYDFVNNADITGLVETKLKLTDVTMNDKGVDEITFPGSHCFHKFRYTQSSKPSGGMCFVVKDYLKDIFQLLKCNNPDMSLGKISIPNCEPFVLSLVYVSPENSPYSSRQTFIDIENDICNKIIAEPNILILGDFNAYTSNKCDLNIIDDNDNDSNFPDPESNTSLLNEIKLPIQRKSNCKQKINNYGNCLLDLVKNLNMIICNGRFGQLSECVTTPSQSVIDYCIGSPLVLKHILNFKVLDFSEIISDVHSGLEILISTTSLMCYRKTIPLIEPTLATTAGVIELEGSDYWQLEENEARKWEHDKADEFVKNIRIPDIERIHDLLFEQPGTEPHAEESIEKACTCIRTLFNDTGILTFGRKNKMKNIKCKPQRQKKNKPEKPYFDEKCKHSRYLFIKARKKFKALQSDCNLTNMKYFGKLYKKQVKCSHRNYVKTITCQIRKLKKGGNQKEYWKLLNKGKESKNHKKNNCTLTDLFEYFKKLNTDENPTLNVDEQQQKDCPLDEVIHHEEIDCCIKRLKTDKASGLDCISNEYIKSTKTLLLPVYTKLFNIIYDTGKFPHSWSVGVIKPIYKNKGDDKKPSNYRPICILSCLGKLFTMVLNERLKLYTESQSIIGEEQMGFRKGYSTTDGVYVLQTLIDLFTSNNLNLYAAFIDLERAFPSISRQLLFKKLSDINIGKKMFTCIKKTCTQI